MNVAKCKLAYTYSIFCVSLLPAVLTALEHHWCCSSSIIDHHKHSMQIRFPQIFIGIVNQEDLYLSNKRKPRKKKRFSMVLVYKYISICTTVVDRTVSRHNTSAVVWHGPSLSTVWLANGQLNASRRRSYCRVNLFSHKLVLDIFAR